MLRPLLLCALIALPALPASAQLGIGGPVSPERQSTPAAPGSVETGFANPAQIIPHLPVADQVRVGWALLRIAPTTNDGRHTHRLTHTYHITYPDCETARASLYNESPSSLCLPVAFPPY